MWLFATLWTVAHQASLSMGSPRQEYWSGLPFSPPGDLPILGIKPVGSNPGIVYVSCNAGGFFIHWAIREAFEHTCLKHQRADFFNLIKPSLCTTFPPLNYNYRKMGEDMKGGKNEYRFFSVNVTSFWKIWIPPPFKSSLWFCKIYLVHNPFDIIIRSLFSILSSFVTPIIPIQFRTDVG